jgi:hypothetical protein
LCCCFEAMTTISSTTGQSQFRIALSDRVVVTYISQGNCRKIADIFPDQGVPSRTSQRSQ